ncbi:MAG: anthranilate phosphoribosyltransferase [Culicoidibacterales bacterium]
MIRTGIKQAIAGNDLSEALTKDIMIQIMEGKASDAQIAAWLCAMRSKGETITEITACAEVMREFSTKLDIEGDLLDIVGTGGDMLSTFNISTTCAIVVAAAGVRIAKHGNRSVSSMSGSSDVLTALGVNINLDAKQCKELLEKIGICFMFAPKYHSSMKYAAPVRAEIGIRTLFNTIGPLTNPAQANCQLLGVYDEKLVEPLAKVLKNLGVRKAFVVHGRDGMDEISITTTTTVCELNNGHINSYLITPEQFGLKRSTLEEIQGKDATYNAEITRQILLGKKGAPRDIVVLNSAFCLYMHKPDLTIKACIELASMIIDSGQALAKLEELIYYSNKIGIVHKIGL